MTVSSVTSASQDLHREERAGERRVVDSRETGRGGNGHQHTRVLRAETHPAGESLAEHRAKFARRHFAADRHAGTDDEDLQQHMHDGLQTGMIAPPTAFLTDGTSVVRVRSSHHITAAMEAPTVTEIARRMAGTLNGPDSCAFSMYPSAKRSTWYSMSVSKPAAGTDRDADDGHRRDQRRYSADFRLLFRLVLRLIRHHCLSHVVCTSSPVRLVIRVTASPSFHRRRIYSPTSPTRT